VLWSNDLVNPWGIHKARRSPKGYSYPLGLGPFVCSFASCNFPMSAGCFFFGGEAGYSCSLAKRELCLGPRRFSSGLLGPPPWGRTHSPFQLSTFPLVASCHLAWQLLAQDAKQFLSRFFGALINLKPVDYVK